LIYLDLFETLGSVAANGCDRFRFVRR